MSWRGQEIWPAFGGLHILGNVLVHTGDTANVADRGMNLGNTYQANPSGSVADAWIYSMGGISNRNSFCTNFFGNQVHGGGFGMNGCGGHVVTALGATSAEAVGHLNETWYQMQDDSRDAKGAAFWASRINCNYDCWTWPMGI